MKSPTFFLHPLKKEILQLISHSNGAYFGDIVERMHRSSSVILEHTLQLKNDGYLKKDQDGGKFILMQ